jgi:hypothetical protein
MMKKEESSCDARPEQLVQPRRISRDRQNIVICGKAPGGVVRATRRVS